jgi:hypothetical protein
VIVSPAITDPTLPVPAAPGGDALQLYLREIGQVQLLTPKEEIELARRIKRGDKRAREHMIKANLRLVVKIARPAKARSFRPTPRGGSNRASNGRWRTSPRPFDCRCTSSTKSRICVARN